MYRCTQLQYDIELYGSNVVFCYIALAIISKYKGDYSAICK